MFYLSNPRQTSQFFGQLKKKKSPPVSKWTFHNKDAFRDQCPKSRALQMEYFRSQIIPTHKFWLMEQSTRSRLFRR